jgi:hypothetical protein
LAEAFAFGFAADFTGCFFAAGFIVGFLTAAFFAAAGGAECFVAVAGFAAGTTTAGAGRGGVGLGAVWVVAPGVATRGGEEAGEAAVAAGLRFACEASTSRMSLSASSCVI